MIVSLWRCDLSGIDSLTFTVHDEVPAEGRLVDEGLGRANEQAAPLGDVRPLSCLARLPSEEVVAGAVGRTWGECCELQQIWVEPAHRRRGIATRLIQEFEERARTRGCRTFYLETFSFQAPSLYLSLGYEIALELHGFPQDIMKYVMIRRFD